MSTEAKRTVGAFLSDYSLWILLLALLDALMWFAVERVYVPRLWSRQDALWSVRTYLASGLLLFDNLCVLWWYASLTREQVRVAKEESREGARPCAVIDLDADLDQMQVLNIGRGLAINVVLIENATQSETPCFTPVGAIAPRMGTSVARDLFPGVDIPSDYERTAVWVAAESRDRSEWIVTATRWKIHQASPREQALAIKTTGNTVVATRWDPIHRAVIIPVSTQEQLGISQVSSVDWLQMNWPRLGTQLDPLRRM